MLPGVRRLLTSRRLTWLSGAGLIVLGSVCLYLSDAVVRGWWQGTLDASGVGFIVGGVVDVLAISGLNQVVRGEDERRRKADLDRDADSILAPGYRWGKAEQLRRAHALLDRGEHLLDPERRDELWVLVRRAEPGSDPQHEVVS